MLLGEVRICCGVRLSHGFGERLAFGFVASRSFGGRLALREKEKRENAGKGLTFSPFWNIIETGKR